MESNLPESYGASRDWLTIKETLERYPLGRTSLFALISEGQIKSAVVKTRKSNIRGRRFIFAPSVDGLLHASANA